MVDRMPYLTWMLWLLAGSLTTVGVRLLLAPRSLDEWGDRDEDIQAGWRARAEAHRVCGPGQQARILGVLLPTQEVRPAHEHRHA